MSLDNEIVAGTIETETASHCNDCWGLPHTSKYLLLTHPYLLQEEYKREVYHELIAEWKAEKLPLHDRYLLAHIAQLSPCTHCMTDVYLSLL